MTRLAITKIVLIVFISTTCARLFAQVKFQKIFHKTVAGYESRGEIIPTHDKGYAFVAESQALNGTSSLPPVGLSLCKIDCHGDLSWSRQYDSLSRQDLMTAVDNEIIETFDHGFMIVGGADIIGNGQGQPLSPLMATGDILLLKTDSMGNQQWVVTIGTGIGEEGRSVIQTNDSGYAISGLTNVNLGASSDVIVVKVDKKGNLLWSKKIGGVKSDEGYSITQTLAGNLVVVGQTSSFNFTTGGCAIYLIVLDQTGNVLLTRSFGDNAPFVHTSKGFDVTATHDGGVIICGQRWEDHAWAYVLKLDVNLNAQWAKVYKFVNGNSPPGANQSKAWSIIQLKDRNYVWAGGGVSDDDESCDKAYIAKLDSNGSIIWSRFYGKGQFGSGGGCSGTNWLESIHQTPDSGFVAGGFSQILSNTFVGGLSSVWIIKTDRFGNSGCNDVSIALRDSSVNVLTLSGGTIVNHGTSQMHSFLLVDTITGTQYNICQSSVSLISASASNNAICKNDSVTISVSTGDLFQWSTGDTTRQIKVSPSVTTVYTVTVVNNNCLLTSYDTIAIQVDSVPIALITGDSAICQGDTLILSSPGGSSLLYNWLPVNGISCNTCQNIISSPAANTVYSLTVQTTNNCIATDTLLVIVNTNTISAHGDSTVCIGQPVPLLATGPGISYQWTPSIGLSCDTCSSIIVIPALTTKYTLTTIDSNFCVNRDSIIVAIDTIRPLAFAGNDTSICEGNVMALNGSGNGTYLWNIGSTTSSITVLPAAPSVTYSLMVSNGTCHDTADITISVLPLPVVDAFTSITIRKGSSANLSTTGAGSYNWHPSSGLNCTSCQNVTATPDITTTYTIIVTAANGCTAMDTVTVYVLENCEDFFIPNVFSPNDDGENDTYLIYGNCIKKFYLIIFNRWGEKVFEAENINASWDGRYKNHKLDTDVFYYTINVTTLSNDIINKSGNLTLLR